MVLRRNRRRIAASGERNYHVRLPSLACRDELVEFGNEGIAIGWAKAWNGGVVQALAVAWVGGGWDAALDAEVGDEGSVDVVLDEGRWGCDDSCDKCEEGDVVLHNDCGCGKVTNFS